MRLPWRKETEKRSGYDLSWVAQQLAFAGQVYPLGGMNTLGYTTTYGNEKAEPIPADFPGLVQGALKSNGIVSACALVRLRVFSEARFQFQQMNKGRPGDLFGTPDLAILERPYPGGTTGDLLARMELDGTFAGNSYQARIGAEIVRLRPDWVEIILEARELPIGPDLEMVTVGFRRIGYYYYEGGTARTKVPALFLPNEVAHYAPFPDPEATYMGMSLLRPVVTEIQADGMATKHKRKFFENAATPNLSVSIPAGPTPMTPKQFAEFVEEMDKQHVGVENAYKTLYTANGADVKVIGADMRQLDFKATQGAGETRIAAAMRVHPVLVGLSEGLSGSSLNAGNYSSAKRSFADGEMRPLWRNAAGSLEVLVPPPTGARLWFDDRDVAYLREDQKDAAEIQFLEAQTLRQYIESGWEPESAKSALTSGDTSLLTHTGFVSVQLQEPGASDTPKQETP